MSADRWEHQAVVVSGLPNVDDYIGRRNRTRIMALNDDGGGDDDDEDDDIHIGIDIKWV
jgi:hypothetical protein